MREFPDQAAGEWSQAIQTINDGIRAAFRPPILSPMMPENKGPSFEESLISSGLGIVVVAANGRVTSRKKRGAA
jgi:hypothetical protein